MEDGSFDYIGYAEYWRASLDAYAAVGVIPDYISIQNNPDFSPSGVSPTEACRFLPTEGTMTVSLNGSDTSLPFPGYKQALDAVITRLEGLPTPPKLVAPDVSTAGSVAEYVRDLDLTRVDAIGHHLYGIIPTLPDDTQLSALSRLGNNAGLPLFQTEMPADGYGSTILLHHALVTEGYSRLSTQCTRCAANHSQCRADGFDYNREQRLRARTRILRTSPLRGSYRSRVGSGFGGRESSEPTGIRLAFPNQQRANGRARKHKYDSVRRQARVR